MAATRRDAATATGGPHQCGPGCPGRGSPFNDAQLQAAYRHHRPELEAQLARMLAARKPYAACYRPEWWWAFSAEAQPYRDNPTQFEQPTDHTPRSPGIEPWIAAYITRRQVAAAGKVRFLARRGLLEPWEAEHIISLGGSKYDVLARALREELAAR
jgi:hypothetical protein